MLRFRVEIVLAAVLAFLTALTVARPQWIEQVLGVDPDAGSGALEWLLVGALGVATLASAVLARRSYRRARLAAA